MEKIIRAFLLKLLGPHKYLSLVSDIYIRLISAGFLKKKYPELFFLRKLIKPGFVCMDIGANVGYYSSFLSRYAGPSGKVLSVEPVESFANIFRKNLAKFGLKNVTLYQTALGGENKTIQMATPTIDGVFRHGLTHIVNEQDKTPGAPEKETDLLLYDVEMKVPDELFSTLDRLDFMKCDVEGYEVFLFPHFIKTISRFKPLIQVEISGSANRKQIIDLLSPLGYSACRLSNNVLEPIPAEEALNYEGGDFYFIGR